MGGQVFAVQVLLSSAFCTILNKSQPVSAGWHVLQEVPQPTYAPALVTSKGGTEIPLNSL